MTWLLGLPSSWTTKVALHQSAHHGSATPPLQLTCSSVNKNWPSGFAWLVASFASSLLEETPALAVQPVAASISCRMLRAMACSSECKA